MRYDVNLSLVFADMPWPDRPRAAADAGFDAVELWWPFDGPSPSDADLSRLVTSIRDAGVTLVGLNFDAGDMPSGERGFVSSPAGTGRFREGVQAAIEIARQVGGCEVFNALYGNRSPDVAVEAQDETAVENLAYAAREARAIGATVVLEALNVFESPRYPILRTTDALERIDAVERETGERIGYLYDTYHMQRMEGNLIATIQAHADRFGHVQIADSPGRTEPGTGEVRYPAVLAALDDSSYEGWVGLEYRPSSASADRFAWMDHLGGDR